MSVTLIACDGREAAITRWTVTDRVPHEQGEPLARVRVWIDVDDLNDDELAALPCPAAHALAAQPMVPAEERHVDVLAMRRNWSPLCVTLADDTHRLTLDEATVVLTPTLRAVHGALVLRFCVESSIPVGDLATLGALHGGPCALTTLDLQGALDLEVA